MDLPEGQERAGKSERPGVLPGTLVDNLAPKTRKKPGIFCFGSEVFGATPGAPTRLRHWVTRSTREAHLWTLQDHLGHLGVNHRLARALRERSTMAEDVRCVRATSLL